MEWKGIHITDGTSQRDREPAAFEAGHFDIDEHRFADLLAMGAEFAKVMKYYNLHNRIEGNWGELLNTDEAVVMAVIISIDLKQIESNFDKIAANHKIELLRHTLHLAREINRWLLRLSTSQHESGELLAHKLATVIRDKLAPQLHNIYAIEQLAGIPWVELDSTPFADVWGLNADARGITRTRATIDLLSDGRDIKEQLRESIQISVNSIAFLQSTAAACLQQSLESQQHEPSVGLFITFLKLYEKAQKRLNRFTLRHLDFYYRQILKADNRHEVAKSYYLLIEGRGGSEPLLIDQGTRFNAGQDAELNDIIYTADDALLVSDARLETLATLYLEKDPMISPESELGFVTRVKQDWPPVPAASSGTDTTRERPVSWTLFGAETRDGAQGSTSDARIGFSVASEVLLLEQGIRKIDMAIELESVVKIDFDSQIVELEGCKSEEEFKKQFGRLFMHCLLQPAGSLESAYRETITAKAASLLSPKLAQDVDELLNEDMQGLFYKFFKKAFYIDLTTPDGWFEAKNYYVQPLASGSQEGESGFRITLELGQEVAPITAYDADLHGSKLQTDLPVLRCRINPQGNFCCYSAFHDLLVSRLQINVDVSDVRNLQVYNQHGQLDPSKPFNPFGPSPGGNAYLVFGNYELARKRLQQLKVDLDWSELPTTAGGFEDFYQGYDNAYGNNSFKVAFSALVDGRWLPEDASLRKRFNLFETHTESNRVGAHKAIKIKSLEYVKPIQAKVAESDYRFDLKTRKGFFRLSLVAPESGFGHGEYGGLMTRTLTANVKLKKSKQESIPNAPYTPGLNGISLSYRASTTLYPSRAANSVSASAEKIFHLHPFGTEIVYPPSPQRACYLLPRYEHEGNLFLGLSGENVAGPLNLLFHLSKDQAQATSWERPDFDWFYLAHNRWCELKPHQILADSTHGFLASGVVKLNIPAEISKGNSVMPGDYYWLRVSVRQGASAFPSCYSIWPHAIKVSHKTKEKQVIDADVEPLTKWSPVVPIPGVASIKPAYPAFGGRQAESDKQLRLRISERLRHKNRASMPWDYEQLILEHFPKIIKVKCFNSMSSTEDRIKPGQVLIVVVPDTGPVSGKRCVGELIDSRNLEKIKIFVENRCSAFAQIEVRNPQYEQVQVRCAVKFINILRQGEYIKKLNQDISDYICPWKPGGHTVQFGWSIRQQDIESHILELDYVESVTDFSMLHITVDNNRDYGLLDTANEAQHPKAVIEPQYPWSLAIPMEQHYIKSRPDSEFIKAEITGVDELAIGSTFIIVGSSENGETE